MKKIFDKERKQGAEFSCYWNRYHSRDGIVTIAEGKSYQRQKSPLQSASIALAGAAKCKAFGRL
jgi:hypothetical protein